MAEREEMVCALEKAAEAMVESGARDNWFAGCHTDIKQVGVKKSLLVS